MAREYIEIEFKGINEELSAILVAELSELGFSGFEEILERLKAYIEKDNFPEDSLQEILSRYNLSVTKQIIPETNWNKEWESNFQPLIVDDWVGIRAHFHEPIISVKHELIITPKMSFGTGHHPTTRMMIRMMKEIEIAGKSVLDIGTGTGILSILADKAKASSVLAIDNDEWSIQNATENILANGCQRINTLNASSLSGIGQFDIILANINRNYIIENLQSIVSHLSSGGHLLLSGIILEDKESILRSAAELSLTSIIELAEDEWIAIGFSC